MNGVYEERFKRFLKLMLDDLKKDIVSGVWNLLPLFDWFSSSKAILSFMSEQLQTLYIEEVKSMSDK